MRLRLSNFSSKSEHRQICRQNLFSFCVTKAPSPGPGYFRIETKPTGSRALLVNVSESDPISEFSTKNIFCSDFDENFTDVFFHDWTFSQIFINVKKKNCCKFFWVQKVLTFEAHNFDGKSWKSYFSVILNIFRKFRLFFWKRFKIMREKMSKYCFC